MAKKSNAELAVVKTTAPTLYELEDHYQALVNSEELVTDQAAIDAYRLDLQAAMKDKSEKVDRVAGFLRHCEMMVGFAHSEIDRLAAVARRHQALIEREKANVLWVMQALGKRHLWGNTSKLVRCDNPPSVKITDEAAVPSGFKNLTLKINARTFERLVETLTESERIRATLEPQPAIEWLTAEDLLSAVAAAGRVRAEPDKTEIKAAIRCGEEVPGADLDMSGEHVELR